MAKTFTVTIDGETFKRTSKTMDYKYAIIGQKDEANERRAAYEYQPIKTDRSNYDYYCALIAGTHEHAQVTARKLRYMSQEDAERDVAEMVAKAHAALDGATSYETYLAVRRKTQIRYFEQNLARGYFRMKVLAWSQTETNARKTAAAEAKWHINVALMQAVEK